MKNLTFIITGMHCPSCKKLVENRIKKIPGVNQVDVNVEKGLAQVTAEREIEKTEIIKSLEGTEYQINN